MRSIRGNTYESKVWMMDLEMDNISETDIIKNVISGIKKKKGGWILTPNVDILRSYHISKDLHVFFNQATYLVPDGTPLIWASKIQGTPFQDKISGSRLIYPLTEELAKNRFKILLLGGNSGTGEKAKKILQNRYPGRFF